MRLHRSVARLVTAASLVSALAGCEGELGIERGGQGPAPFLGRDAGPRADAFTSALPGPDASRPLQPDAATSPPAPPPPGCGTTVEQEVMGLASEARASSGLGPLSCDAQMTLVARAHSQDMCDRGYFSHTALDGRSPFDRMREGGVRFGAAGENIAQGQRSASEVHAAWMGSSGHRMNILGGGYRRIGVGLSECGGRMYWTQVFAD